MAKIRYHLDENMDTAVATGLRRRGIDVTTTAESGLMQAADHEQLTFATANERVLVTRDSDFLRLAAQGVSHAGIAFTRHGRRVIGPTVLALAALHRTFTAEDMRNHVEYL